VPKEFIGKAITINVSFDLSPIEVRTKPLSFQL
jgi:hypothetical protein